MRGFIVLLVASLALARPTTDFDRRQNNFRLKNGQDAIALNNRFKTLNANSPCKSGENACVQNGFAQCVGSRFTIQQCAPGTVCAALPLVNAPGTSITCTTAADRDRRIAETGAVSGGNGGGNGGGNNNGGNNGGGQASPIPPPPSQPPTGGNNNNDAQKSLTLDPAVIASNFGSNGQAQPAAGQVPSLTSTNNFINFCKTVRLPITNGLQLENGSCNPAPMGVIAAKSKMPSSKFVSPANGDTIPARKTFTIQMAVENLETGHFVNPNSNYFAAPQQVNNQGVIRGHSHVVIQKLESLRHTRPVNPTNFVFFKGMNNAAQGGVLTVEVPNGLEPGVYRMTSINTAANHQPVLVAVAQHGALDDAVYFTVR